MSDGFVRSPKICQRVVAALGCLVALPLSCSDQTDQQTQNFCEAGARIFCRCRGGAAGTKRCSDDGDGFGSCETARGSCDEASAGAGGGEPQPGGLLGSCASDADCSDGMSCPMGFCTKPCETYEDCGAQLGDCLVWQDGSMCAPYCIEHQDCAPFGAMSLCSYTENVLPPWPVAVCANWPEVTYPPDDYPPDFPCDDDRYCNFGDERVERVCGPVTCTSGCHSDSDCQLEGQVCSLETAEVGVCIEDGPADLDDCPGLPIALSLADPSAVVSGNTALLSPPSEHTFEAMSDGSSCGAPGTNAEESVYAVTMGNDGVLRVDAVPLDSGYDIAVYARYAGCSPGTQLACSDDGGGAGASEAMAFEVFAGETIWVFVDGWNGSVGSYELTFGLE
jgi:hypothetical protein